MEMLINQVDSNTLMLILMILEEDRNWKTAKQLQLQSSKDYIKLETSVREEEKDTQMIVILPFPIPTTKQSQEQFNQEQCLGITRTQQKNI